jgi:uncharacterized protein (TIGR00369 family)
LLHSFRRVRVHREPATPRFAVSFTHRLLRKVVTTGRKLAGEPFWLISGGVTMGEVHRLSPPQISFSLQTAGRLMTEIFPQWVQDLALLVESIETIRPPGALPDWTVRLPYSKKVCSEAAAVCTQALMALADTAMVLACSAAWNGYRPMTSIDQTTHFLRPVNFDVVADARVVRIGRNTSFGRVMLLNAADRRPVGMVASAYAML